MTAYVDHARIPYRRMLMSHLVADTHDELMAMARRIGVRARWIQKEGEPDEHFDVCDSMRESAVGCGAMQVTSHHLVAIIRAKREAAALAAK